MFSAGLRLTSNPHMFLTTLLMHLN